MEDYPRKSSGWLANFPTVFSKRHKRNKIRMAGQWSITWIFCMILLVGILMYAWPVCAKEAVPESLSIDPQIKKETLWVGDKVEIKVTVSPKEAANVKLNWDVSDPQIFEVVKQKDKTVLVVKKMGKATVTVKAGEVSTSVELRAWDWVLPFSLTVVAAVIGMFVVVIAVDEKKKRASQTKDFEEK